MALRAEISQEVCTRMFVRLCLFKTVRQGKGPCGPVLLWHIRQPGKSLQQSALQKLIREVGQCIYCMRINCKTGNRVATLSACVAKSVLSMLLYEGFLEIHIASLGRGDGQTPLSVLLCFHAVLMDYLY